MNKILAFPCLCSVITLLYYPLVDWHIVTNVEAIGHDDPNKSFFTNATIRPSFDATKDKHELINILEYDCSGNTAFIVDVCLVLTDTLAIRSLVLSCELHPNDFFFKIGIAASRQVELLFSLYKKLLMYDISSDSDI